MEHVAQRSFKYNDEFSSRVHRVLRGRQRRVQCAEPAPRSTTRRPFETALQQLEAGWTRQDRQRRGATQRSRAGDALRRAAPGRSRPDRVGAEPAARPGEGSACRAGLPVRALVAGAGAGAADRQPTSRSIRGGYLAVISDLLWSVKREVTLQPAGPAVRAGSAAAGDTARGPGFARAGPGRDTRPFFQALMKLHHPVLKLRRAKSRRDARESGMAPLGSRWTAPASAAGRWHAAQCAGAGPAVDEPARARCGGIRGDAADRHSPLTGDRTPRSRALPRTEAPTEQAMPAAAAPTRQNRRPAAVTSTANHGASCARATGSTCTRSAAG